MPNKLMNINNCWCGSDKLNKFSEYYLKCDICNTLIRSPRYPDEYFFVRNDNQDFYGNKYWFEFQKEKYNHANIYQRTRSDLSERCVYWLKHIFRYKIPPANTLEIGCGHGGLVALMKKAGFNAIGTELSSWVVNYASCKFDINVLQGRVEDLNFNQKFDCIYMMDVLEHFTNPKESMETIAKLLKDDGILVIQTPCFRETNYSYEQLVQKNDRFLEPLKAYEEHLSLFSERGLIQLLNLIGLPFISIEPQLFPYDIFIFASKFPLKQHNEQKIVESLQKTGDGWLILAMLDLFTSLEASKADCEKKMKSINKLEKWLKESEIDRAARLEAINKLSRQLEESEADRVARLEAVNILTKQLKEMEDSNAGQLEIIENLNKQLEALENRLSLYEYKGNSTTKAKIIKFIKRL